MQEHAAVLRGSNRLALRAHRLTPFYLFGEADLYPFIAGMAGAAEVIEIIKTESDTVNFGGSWHCDTAYFPAPASGTVLYALEVPDAGGDTQFDDRQTGTKGVRQRDRGVHPASMI